MALRTLLGLVLSVGAVEAGGAAEKVTLVKPPDAGIQPQATADDKGTLHLVYFRGEPGSGDLFYVRREAGKEQFSRPVRVNSHPGSAIAMGTVRGGQLALGKGGRVHVAWNGSGKDAESRGMLYARLNDRATAFEPQRNLMRETSILDGGGTVAADTGGNVYVAWHGQKAGDDPQEGERQIWVARSTDEGKTFATETPAWKEPTGVCACCSTRAFADDKRAVYLLYRSARARENRDIYLLCSTDKGESFRGALVHRWKVPG